MIRVKHKVRQSFGNLVSNMKCVNMYSSCFYLYINRKTLSSVEYINDNDKYTIFFFFLAYQKMSTNLQIILVWLIRFAHDSHLSKLVVFCFKKWESLENVN